MKNKVRDSTKDILHGILVSLIGIIFLVLLGCEKTQTPTDTVKDIDKNIYNIITIGNQIWLKENLKVTKLNDGTIIPEIRNNETWSNTKKPAYCWVLNIKNNSDEGALYNWYTVNTNKLCPEGWHVPSDTEFKTLETYLGMTSEAVDTIGWRGTKEANVLKATYGWSWGIVGTDDYGFSALGTGYRFINGNFEHVGEQTGFWTSTSNNDIYAWRRDIHYAFNTIYRGYTYKQNGCSVRCLKD